MKKASWYIDHSLKPPKAFFDWCYSQIHTFKWSNKKKTILASDRENCKVIEKRLTKSTNLNFIDKFYSFAIVLVTKKRIEIQTYCFWSEIKDGKQIIEQEFTNLECLTNDQHIKVGWWYDRQYSPSLVPMTYQGGPYSGVKFYDNNWEEKIKTISELKYIDFSDCDNLWSCYLPRFYKYRKEIEFLQKIKATTIARQLMHSNTIDMRSFSEKWLRENKRLLKNSTKNFNDFELERRIKNRGGKVVPGIENYMIFSDVNVVPPKIGIVRFQNWVIKNQINFGYYRDYLSLLKDLKLKPDNENLIIPKDLRKAHDNAVALLNQMNRDVGSHKFEKRMKQTLKYETTIGDYAFVVPKSLNEIVIEGKQLHHCVGGSRYISDHKNGKTTIIFVRKKDTPCTPYFTLELKSKSIVQLRGKHNKNATDEIWAAANEWLAWVKKGCKNGKKKIKSKKEETSAA